MKCAGDADGGVLLGRIIIYIDTTEKQDWRYVEEDTTAKHKACYEW